MDLAGNQVAGLTTGPRAHTAQELMSGLARLPQPLVLWDRVSTEKPQGLPSTHRRALDTRQASGTLFPLHASGSRRSSRSFHAREPPTSFRPPQARLPEVTHL